MSTDDWSGSRLLPLLDGLAEVMPWVRQWHNDIEPALSQSPAAYLTTQRGKQGYGKSACTSPAAAPKPPSTMSTGTNEPEVELPRICTETVKFWHCVSARYPISPSEVDTAMRSAWPGWHSAGGDPVAASLMSCVAPQVDTAGLAVCLGDRVAILRYGVARGVFTGPIGNYLGQGLIGLVIDESLPGGC